MKTARPTYSELLARCPWCFGRGGVSGGACSHCGAFRQTTPNQEPAMHTAIQPATPVLIHSVDMFGLQGRDDHPTIECSGKTAYVIEHTGTEFADYGDDDTARIDFYRCLVPGLGIFTFADYEIQTD